MVILTVRCSHYCIKINKEKNTLKKETLTTHTLDCNQNKFETQVLMSILNSKKSNASQDLY